MNFKKILIGVISGALLLMNSAVYAADYAPTDNSVSAGDLSTYKTVLITSEDGIITDKSKIVYINQSDDGFGAAANFVLKANPEPGTYYMHIGGADETADCTTFVIAEEIPDTVLMDCVGKSEEYAIEGNTGKFVNIGYTVTTKYLSEYKYAVMNISDGENTISMAYPLSDMGFNTQISNGSEALIGIQINEIPADKADNITVGLAKAVEFTSDAQ